MINLHQIEKNIIIILIIAISFCYIDLYFHLGIIHHRNGKMDNIYNDYTKTENIIETLNIKSIPPYAYIISDASNNICSIENILSNWDKEVNYSNLMNMKIEYHKDLNDVIKNLKSEERLLILNKEKNKFLTENNFRQNANLPKVDFKELLKVLDHLQLQEDYILDYIYYYDQASGIPIVYAKRNDMQPIEKLSNFDNWEKYLIRYHLQESLDRPFLNFIELDQSALSYFQLAVLALYCDHFFLYWHASYRDETIITKIDDIYKIIDLDGIQIESNLNSKINDKLLAFFDELSNIDTSPYVIINDDNVRVVFYYYTYWGGLFKVDWIVSKDFPHKEISFTKQQIINFEPSIIF